MKDVDEPPRLVSLLAAKQSPGARELWDAQCVIDDDEDFDREMRRLLESIDRLYDEMKRQESER